VFLPLAGYTAQLHIRRLPESEEAAAILTTENGGITITPSAGRIEWQIEEGVLDDMDGEYHYELRIISPQAKPISILKGIIKISPEVVHP